MEQLFKKIFDLDPNEVENFITQDYKDRWTRNGYTFPKDMEVKIYWYPTCNEFYVFHDPKLETKDYKKYSFRGKRVNLSKYFDLTFYDHAHYDFQEIYGRITGETTYSGRVGLYGKPKDYDKMWTFWYKKEYTYVCHKADGTYFILDWDDETEEEIRKPVPTDLMEEVLKVVND